MQDLASCAFSVLHTTSWALPSRSTGAISPCAAAEQHDTLRPIADDQVDVRRKAKRSPPILLRDLFGPEHTGVSLGSSRDSWESATLWTGRNGSRVGHKGAENHRLDRLQEVADLALEERGEPYGMSRGCADIGADHGQLAICLLANGIPLVVAGDRAAAPLEAARENARLYLRHAPPQGYPSVSLAGAPSGSGAPRVRRCNDAPEMIPKRSSGGSGDGGRGSLPRLECRLGDGLAVLEEGEVDTVCIAGMGVKTIIQILSANDGSSSGVTAVHDGSSKSREPPSLSSLGVQRLVLQPMDARLEYMHDLRVWLRENGWRIKKETIVSTLGKGGKHAFLTLRADLAQGSKDFEKERRPSWEACSAGWPAGTQQEQERSDWLGEFLPVRTTDPDRLRGKGRQRERQEALTFLAYLRHQRDWLRAIESARLRASPGRVNQGAAVSESVGGVLTAVEAAIREAGDGDPQDLDDEKESLVTARRWRRSNNR